MTAMCRAAAVGRLVTVALVGFTLVWGPEPASAQMTSQQPSEQRPPRPLPPAPGANICTTQWGWCQLPTIAAPFGVGCTCLTADNREIAGTTRYFPYYGPASPYLQPHTQAPETVR